MVDSRSPHDSAHMSCFSLKRQVSGFTRPVTMHRSDPHDNTCVCVLFLRTGACSRASARVCRSLIGNRCLSDKSLPLFVRRGPSAGTWQMIRFTRTVLIPTLKKDCKFDRLYLSWASRVPLFVTMKFGDETKARAIMPRPRFKIEPFYTRLCESFSLLD